MNTLLINLLTTIIKQLISSALFQFIQNAVERAEQSDDPGETKRANVLSQIKNIPLFQETATWLINLAIETAVAKVRSS